MTLHNKKHSMGCCPACSHDLVAAPTASEHAGHYFCSSSRCKHSVEKLKKPVPRSPNPYKGTK